jgi:pyruvate dehydrogenase E2 component (dihydrolipoamide acetyltransferase)
MPVNVVMPKLGLTMKEGRVDRWLFGEDLRK